MKKLLVLALALIMVFSLAACGGTLTPSSLSGGGDSTMSPASSNDSDSSEQSEPDTSSAVSSEEPSGWPDNEFTRQLPKPDCEFKENAVTQSKYCGIYPIFTREEAVAYVAQLENAGFEIYSTMADTE